ncbi:uncharacterized protein FIBRA_08320 [Fibroporia radiculosa]|uniref:FAD-binding domain-containing protein n=1 Tax=Fibroporia radiculosa TaxID=599839 RepID=J4GH37_9APHY|nr:uncharacterized protein FIBRA_08320 [Fibroporia radiculosa]CCM06073.1 predicted protein [Fibroporia radiculosa]
MSRKAPLQLHVLIVGCGLGGVAAAHCLAQAGHQITILETASAISEVGAGIQVSPNITRLLERWGLGDALARIVVEPQAIVLRRYCTGERIGYTRVGRFANASSGPYYHIHRADLHKLLYDLVAPYVTLRLNSTVVGIDPGRPSVQLASGETIEGDLIIGADGIKSFVQQVVLGQSNLAQGTGDAVYRAMIPTDLMLADPELRSFVETPEMTIWMGPRRHMVGYNIRGGKLYNLGLAHPDDGSVESWTLEGSADKMRTEFSDFEPRVRKILSHVQSTLKWRLMDRQPLPTWNHSSGRVTLLGDACHPMLPYRAQGAAMAIEDAAVLGNLLSRISSILQLPALLQAYESLRLPRTADTQAASRLNQHVFHMSDGPQQEARDAGMREAMTKELEKVQGNAETETFTGNPNQWADKKKTDAQFLYDADEAVDEWWREKGERLIGCGMSRL